MYLVFSCSKKYLCMCMFACIFRHICCWGWDKHYKTMIVDSEKEDLWGSWRKETIFIFVFFVFQLFSTYLHYFFIFKKARLKRVIFFSNYLTNFSCILTNKKTSDTDFKSAAYCRRWIHWFLYFITS